jgi:hypothetical protein
MTFVDADATKRWLKSVMQRAPGSTVWLVSPFVTKQGLAVVQKAMERDGAMQLRIVTRIDPISIALGSSDPEEIAAILERFSDRVQAWDLPNLHAKLFLVEGKEAVFGSSNLTGGGLGRNLELGVRVGARRVVSELKVKVDEWIGGRASIGPGIFREAGDQARKELKKLVEVATQLDYGLPVFASEKTYLEEVWRHSRSLRNGPIVRKDFLEQLKSKKAGVVDGPYARSRRLQFLQRTGIAQEAGSVVTAGPIANTVNSQKELKEHLAGHLQREHAEIGLLIQLAREKESWERKEALARLAKEHWPIPQERFADALRWAVAVNLLAVTKGGEKHIEKFGIPQAKSARRRRRSKGPVASAPS